MALRLSALCLLLFCAVAPFTLFAETAEEIRAQIVARQSELEALNKEIAQFEKELSAVGEKKQTLQSAVNALDISYKKTQAKIKAIQSQIATTELEIRELSGDISTKEESIALDSAAIAESMRGLYQNSQASLVEMVLANQSLTALWDDAAAAIEFQDTLNRHVESLHVAKEELTEDKNAEEEKRKQLVGQRANLTSEQQSLAIQKKEQQSLLVATKSQESTYQAMLKEKQAAKTAFEQSLNDLESKLEFTLDPSRLPPSGKGVLRWPLDKVVVTQQFGKTADSGRLYTSGSHNGVDFRATIGTPIRAALGGVVQGTGNSDAVRGCYSYGKWILVKHNNGLSTLYAHLSQIEVVEGESVSTGQAIGYSGATGYATGPHLHFGVYASNAVTVRKLGTKTPCGQATIPVSATSGYLNPLDYL